ncbi:sugar transporter [Lentibacter algarum]|uniref:sugar transporter n=1 Tax=Lentibacter algarum TaxID=576131 RepID=UPI001C0748C6|nr:sugar transporter [Lentibacter algarum]MBU2980674.1 sugar transporter [Lentibacter algarum]
MDETNPPESAPEGNPAGKRRNNNANKNGGRGPKAAPSVVEVAPIAKRAEMKRRHWGLILSFVLLVALPLLVSAWYLWARADDMYASSVGFTVRQEGAGSAADIVGTFAALSGGSSQSDTDILYEFLQNQNMVELIDNTFDLTALYSVNHDKNPLFSLAPDATLEDKVSFWEQIAKISYDQSSQLMEVEVLAFDPETAQRIAADILKHCQNLINELNATARADRIKYAQADLELAVERLKTARGELIQFRTRNKIVDLDADLQGRLGVVNTLQQQLAEALVELDLLAVNTSKTDPRYVQAQNLITVIRKRIEAERTNVVSGGVSETGVDYPTLLAEYEGLVVNREYGEQGYRAALVALDVARAEALRQSSYLAAYLQPTFPESSLYPKRWLLFGLIFMFLCLGWAILTLIFYSVRDSQ